jgi:hypothetical protein
MTASSRAVPSAISASPGNSSLRAHRRATTYGGDRDAQRDYEEP